ncbi:MAG: hypothetical protein EBU01_10030, partial [Crocinitomicaceae bacterium]|nr:hypothetical protein [Crocinitomicaceae bacterium]
MYSSSTSKIDGFSEYIFFDQSGRVAISDSGTQQSHEDLQSNILSSSSRNYKLNANNTPGLESPWLGDSTPSAVDMA